MAEFLTQTITLPVWFVVLMGVIYAVTEWASGYRDKLSLKLYELSKESPDAE